MLSRWVEFALGAGATAMRAVKEVMLFAKSCTGLDCLLCRVRKA